MLIAILGRQPLIGFAELQSIVGNSNVGLIGKNIAKIDAQNLNFDRFGSVIKFARVLDKHTAASPHNLQKIIINTITKEIPQQTGVKNKIGLSFYNVNISTGQINSMGLSIKKALKNKGYSLRLVPNNSSALSSAQIIHNKLTAAPGIELVIIKNNDSYIIARTLHEQDIEAYAARDQARPKRDARVGMLPPKLAQTIINLALGPNGDWELGNGKWENNANPVPSSQTPAPALLDPFCGTGVVLQEAALMGFDVYGTDLEPRMIEFSKINLDWLANKFNLKNKINLSTGDATNHSWESMPQFVAGETYLGRPLTSLPKPELLNQIIQDVNTLHKKALQNIYNQLPKGGRMCLAVPAWQVAPGKFKSLPVLDQLSKIGYNQLEFKNINAKDLIYAREDQIVGRQLVVLTK